MGRKRSVDQLGLDLPETPRPWPDPRRMPHNYGGAEVGEIVEPELIEARKALIITGYASLERVLDLMGAVKVSLESRTAGEPLRLLIGTEPSLRTRPSIGSERVEVQQEIQVHWLRQGISLLQVAGLLATVELIDAERLVVRSSGRQRVHAKIYLTEDAVTLGSSNYTDAGLRRSAEANVRFEGADEAERYHEAADLAENLWAEARPYTDGFRDLLSRLLNNVGWQEALARACAELLEGEWERSGHVGRAITLWPSQRQGISQALWILENVGAVLIADATGSGKTRTAAHLLNALQERAFVVGGHRPRQPLLVVPPAVRRSWRRELALAGESATVVSHGVLSHSRARRRQEIDAALRNTRVLMIDEAHNFLNRFSSRSRRVFGTVADFTILLTATPINRGVQDLVAIVDLLGADNFSDEVLEIVGRVRRGGGGKVASPAERGALREALKTFVVRRTKDEFNELVDADPAEYTNALGNRCRYPIHQALTFTRDHPADDLSRAMAIREKAKNLRGITNLRKLKMPGFLRSQGWNEERFVRMRLRGARALAMYRVMSSLRSSKPALVEHLVGTDRALEVAGIRDEKPNPSGDIIGRLATIRDDLPVASLDPGVLPQWLTDPEQYAEKVEDERKTYEDILATAHELSNHRSEWNARYLLQLLELHPRLLAFDSHVISLYYVQELIKRASGVPLHLATGASTAGEREQFAEHFALGADGEPSIGLCSDALAEGVNLQGASAVVHLDLPTVVRVLEQRIGRVDRMDSPHTAVEVHWPQEPKEFTLGSDERLFMRLRDVEDLLGSNVPLPEELNSFGAELDTDLDLNVLIEQVETATNEGRPEATLAGAFDEVRRLVSGSRALVPPEVYASMVGVETQVLASISVVEATEPWVFFAIGATDRSLPRWVLLDLGEDEATPLTALDRIAAELRKRLSADATDLPFDNRAQACLETALQRLESGQRGLLPLRKRRALEELEHVLSQYLRNCPKTDTARERLLRDLLGSIGGREGTVDLEALAEWWLQLLRPEWQEHIRRPHVKRPTRLKHLGKELRREPLSTERLQTIKDHDVRREPMARRVVAAIVGVGHGPTTSRFRK